MATITSTSNDNHQTKKRKRSNGEEKEQRKVKFLNKIMSGDKATREATFKKRKPTLKKKAKELEILCDVKVCMICYGPDGSIDTWPENQNDFKDAIKLYKEFGGKRQHSSIKDIIASKNKKIDPTPCKPINVDAIYDLERHESINSVSYLESKINYLKEKIDKIASLNEAKRSQEAAIIGESSNSMSTTPFTMVPLNELVQFKRSQPLTGNVVNPILIGYNDHGGDQWCGAFNHGAISYAAYNNNNLPQLESKYKWGGLVMNNNNNNNMNGGGIMNRNAVTNTSGNYLMVNGGNFGMNNSSVIVNGDVGSNNMTNGIWNYGSMNLQGGGYY